MQGYVSMFVKNKQNKTKNLSYYKCIKFLFGNFNNKILNIKEVTDENEWSSTESQLAKTYRLNCCLPEKQTDEGKQTKIRLLNTKCFIRVYLKMVISARHCLPIQIEATLPWNDEYSALSQITTK